MVPPTKPSSGLGRISGRAIVSVLAIIAVVLVGSAVLLMPKLERRSPPSLELSLPPIVLVPDLLGETAADARRALERANLALGAIRSRETDEVPVGAVVAQIPRPGTAVEIGSEVDLTLADLPIESAPAAIELGPGGPFGYLPQEPPLGLPLPAEFGARERAATVSVLINAAIAELDRGDRRAAYATVHHGLSLVPEHPVLLQLRRELLAAAESAAEATAGETATPPPPPPADEAYRLRRHPSLDAPESVERDELFAVLFQLTEERRVEGLRIDPGPDAALTAEGELEMRLPDDRATPDQPLEWDLDVILSAPGLDVESASTAVIRVRPTGDSGVAAFKLRPKDLQDRTGPDERSVQVTLWHRGSFLARVSRSVMVRRPDLAESPGPEPMRTRPLTAVSDASMSDTGASVALDLALEPPDLTLYIQHHPDPAVEGYAEILVHTQHLNPSGPRRMTMPGDVRDWLADQYARFSELGRGIALQGVTARGDERADRKALRIAALEAFGERLYRRFAPEAFKRAFWALRDKLGDRFDSIQIFTDDPILPWELMRPHREGEQAGFLGVDYRVGRWHIGDAGRQLQRPPQLVHMTELAAVIPEYSGDQSLAALAEERDILDDFPGYRHFPGRAAAFDSLGDAPELGSRIIHFAGHGAIRTSPSGLPRYVIVLEDGELDSLSWLGLASWVDHYHPFIFMNACDIGQGQHVANFVEGWAAAALETGASGYLGALWPISDRGAAAFAGEFYGDVQDALTTGGRVSLGDVLRRARRRFYDDGDATFLSYAFYSDPNLKIELRR